jgi:hypothetical protein
LESMVNPKKVKPMPDQERIEVEIWLKFLNT